MTRGRCGSLVLHRSGLSPPASCRHPGAPVVGIVAPHLRNQLSMLLGDRPMPVRPAPVLHRRQRAGVTLLGRYLPHHVLTLPRPSPNVAEAEEGERCPIPVSPVPRRHEHYEGATTPTRRIAGHLFVSLPVPTRFLHASCSPMPSG